MTEKREKITGLPSLFRRLSTLYDDIEDRAIEHKIAAEMNNSAGKMIVTARTILEAYALSKTPIPSGILSLYSPEGNHNAKQLSNDKGTSKGKKQLSQA